MTAPTRLGNLINSKPLQPPTGGATKMQAALSGSRVLEAVLLPGLDTQAMMTLVGSERFLDIEGEVVLAMETRKLAPGTWNEGKFELERAKRVLAEAVREHDPLAKAEGRVPPPFGSLAEWGQLAPSIINAIWGQYAELVERFDPLADLTTLEPIEAMELRAAIEKKNLSVLRSFGLQKLCAYLLTSGDQHASSQTPKFGAGPEPLDSSTPTTESELQPTDT
jgi:hypothetical protein